MFEQRRHGRFFDDLTGIHHDDPVGGRGDHAEIVGDHQHRGLDLRPQQLDEIEDLRLDRHVERGGGFVGDQQAGPAGDRHRDHHPLAHAAGQLVRIVMGAAFGCGDAHLLQELHRPAHRVAAAQSEMLDQHLGDLESDGVDRIETGHRLLKDHRDDAAANRQHFALRQGGEVATVELDGALLDHALLAEQTHDRERRYRFARAAFPDEPDDLAPADAETHVLEHPDGAVDGVENDVELVDLQQRCPGVGHRSRILGSRMSRNPSPSRLKPMIVTPSAALPDNARYGSVRR